MSVEAKQAKQSAFYIFRKEIWTVEHQRVGFNPYIAITDAIEGIDIDYPEDFAFAEKVISL